MQKALVCLTLLCLCTALVAQSPVVIPTGGNYATTSGNSYAWGVGKYAPARCSFIYAQKVMPPGPFTIKAFKLRPRNSVTYPGLHTYEIEVGMSNNANDPAAGYTKSFIGNRGPDYTLVVPKTKVTFPACTSGNPEPFNISFTLTKPFTYTGKAFLIEFKTHGTQYTYPAGNYYLDAASTTGYTAPASAKTYAMVGPGCPTNFTIFPPTTGGMTGGLYYVYGYTRVASVPFIDVMGVSDKTWGALTLPFKLDFLGATGCSVQIDWVAANTGLSNSTATSSTYSVWGEVPVVPVFVGARLYHQWYALDPTYNAAGFGASRGAYVDLVDGTFSGGTDCLHFYSYGQVGPYLFTGDEGAARYYTGKALIIQLIP